ncbi:hypothetical protein PAPYR_3500 [Paratrimastix pyriformis]|uniref:Uncharacterized protein n=1 Tax=Paratrimastix pyriformis TaxID=342808 RepID=A0ABQ8UUQ0_9EUKA|nr:hypothetical protein PAPYR_3500 [Paratrimastix pyriformis]
MLALFLLFSVALGALECPANLYACSQLNRCMLSQADCEYGVSRCSGETPFWCNAAKGCAAGPGYCCDEGYRYCPNGQCVLITEKCPADEIGHCPANQNQFHCLNGTCATCPEDCRITKCPANAPYQCPDYSCAASLEKCPCPAGLIRCPYFPMECHINELCPAKYSHCPFYKPNRCANGVCVARTASCPADTTGHCGANEQLCPSGQGPDGTTVTGGCTPITGVDGTCQYVNGPAPGPGPASARRPPALPPMPLATARSPECACP